MSPAIHAGVTLEPILIQAGRHFADSLNMAVFSGSDTRRQEATRLAWAIVSMVRPQVVAGRLEVTDPGDQDIKRLASEVLGVGAALELLRGQQIIDARTIRKVSSRFDFEANGINGAGKVSIEAKGTTELASVVKQRASFRAKLNAGGLLAAGAGRGYSRAVGIIFSTWTRGSARRHDVELLDPEGETHVDSNDATRALIRFYARRFDETAGLPEAAECLWQLAAYEGLFDARASLREFVGDSLPGRFNRSSFVFERPSGTQTFWGSFWEGAAVPCPLIVGDQPRSNHDLRYAYTGIDRRVIDFIRARRFDELLAFRPESGYFTLSNGKGEVIARFLADDDGVVRGWMNSIPPDIKFKIE